MEPVSNQIVGGHQGLVDRHLDVPDGQVPKVFCEHDKKMQEFDDSGNCKKCGAPLIHFYQKDT